MITATQIGKGHPGSRIYELSEPVPYDYNFDTNDYTGTTQFVVVSAATVPGSGPEVYIFASDKDGKVLDWAEMDGSLKGTLIHEDAITNAGWEVAS